MRAIRVINYAMNVEVGLIRRGHCKALLVGRKPWWGTLDFVDHIYCCLHWLYKQEPRKGLKRRWVGAETINVNMYARGTILEMRCESLFFQHRYPAKTKSKRNIADGWYWKLIWLWADWMRSYECESGQVKAAEYFLLSTTNSLFHWIFLCAWSAFTWLSQTMSNKLNVFTVI